jgi:hypothetical protein
MKLLEEEYLIKQRTLQLLDDVDGNKAKLQEICDKTASNLLKLANEWEQHRVPLINDYRKKKGAIAKRKEDAKVKLVKVKEMRDDCKALLRDLREKDERAKVLAAEYDKMPKDVKRCICTHAELMCMAHSSAAASDRVVGLAQVELCEPDLGHHQECQQAEAGDRPYPERRAGGAGRNQHQQRQV